MKNLTLSVCFLFLTVLLFGQDLTVEGKIGIGVDPPAHELDILSTDFEPVKISSNSAAGTSILFENGGAEANIGLGNSDDIIFRNGNGTDARITSNGDFVLENGRRLGINIDNPVSYFQLQNTGQNNTLFSMWVASGNGLFKLNGRSHIHLQNLNGSTTNFWHLGQRDDESFDIAYGAESNSFVAQSDAKLSIQSDGDVGIGTTDPLQELDVAGDIAISGGLKRLLYYSGTTIDATVGFIGTNFWIDNNRSNSDTEISSGDDMIFRVNGQDIALFIDQDGRIGTNNGVITPASDFTIQQNSANNPTTGLRLVDDDNTYWSIWTDNGDDLAFADNGTFRAQIEDGTGSFNITSDKRLKENIRPMDNVLDRVLELKPSWYNYRSDKKKQQTLGFIAQEVEEQFPDFVKEAHGYKALTYDYFAILSIKAIQELHAKVETLEAEKTDFKTQIDGLHKELTELKQLVQQLAATEKPTSGAIQSSTATVSSAKLEQNQPNPFSEATTIRYFVPENVRQAEIRIATIDGKLIKTVPVQSGHGQLTLDAYTLQQGTYTYTLFLDGKMQETKQMILTRQ